ncbi:MAG: hypothetical protein JF599_06480 [Verrucomicrobia bacterium]|nr:hypothetical protein [Verrucomicrobiota bacterium]
MKTGIIFFVLGLLLPFSAGAQTNFENEPQVRSFRLLNTKGVLEDLVFDLNGKKIPVFSTTTSLSQPYPCPATSSLVLYRETPPPPSAPPGTKPVKTIVAEVKIQKQFLHSIVVLTPLSEESSATFQGMAFEDLPKEHKPGTFRLINLSSLPAALSLNRQVTPAAAGQSIITPYELNEGILQIKLAVQRGNRWSQAIGSERHMGPNMRAFGIVLNDKPAYEDALPISCCLVFDYVALPPSQKEMAAAH